MSLGGSTPRLCNWHPIKRQFKGWVESEGGDSSMWLTAKAVEGARLVMVTFRVEGSDVIKSEMAVECSDLNIWMCPSLKLC